MATLSELITSIHTALHSYTGLHEQVGYLTAACDADDLALQVSSSDTVLRGISEIDDELIYVESSAANVASVAPFGRGYRGSTAASHAQNAMVIFDPAFPKVDIRRAIKEAVEALNGVLYRIKTTTFIYDATVIGHDLPDDCEAVLAVKAQLPEDPSTYWAPVNRWAFDGVSPETGAKVLNLYATMTQGLDVQVVYRAKFGELTGTFADAGLPDSYADMLLYAVTAKMVRFLDPARLQLGSVENISRAQVVQAGDAGRLANQLYAMYQTRLAEERRRLLEITPTVPNYLPR